MDGFRAKLVRSGEYPWYEWSSPKSQREDDEWQNEQFRNIQRTHAESNCGKLGEIVHNFLEGEICED
jgi:hypothetical protein